MADPSYQAPAVDAQHEADAALARSLAAEQERGFRSSQAARDYSQPARTLAGSQAGGTGATYTNLTYQPRVRRAPVIPGARAAYSAPSPPGQDPDRSMVPGMPGPVEAKQWQGEINKFAESEYPSLRPRVFPTARQHVDAQEHLTTASILLSRIYRWHCPCCINVFNAQSSG